MAKFSTELPLDLIEQFKSLADGGAEKMLGEMVDAGAEVVEKNIRKNMKKAFKNPSRLEKCLRITKVYKTPYDDGVNKKVAFYGYLEGTEGTVTKKTVTRIYKERYTKGKGKVGKLVGQNIGRAGTTATKTYSHNYGVPAPLVAMAREYGTSSGEKKKPFVRPAFKKAEIENAMLKVQEKYIHNE